MTMTDPIGDMLTRIRNATMAQHEKVDIPASRQKQAIAQILKDEGFIKDFQVIKDGPQATLRIFLKYGPNRESVISGLKRISKPGLRIYVNKHDVPRVLGGLGVAIISTSKGLMPDRQARKEGIGGEVICYVW